MNMHFENSKLNFLFTNCFRILQKTPNILKKLKAIKMPVKASWTLICSNNWAQVFSVSF